MLFLRSIRLYAGGYQEQIGHMELNVTDPELIAIEEHFVNEQVSRDLAVLDKNQQQLIAVVSLVVQQSDTMLSTQTAEALDDGLTPVQVREAVYQCAPYAGFPRAEEALTVINQVFSERGIKLFESSDFGGSGRVKVNFKK